LILLSPRFEYCEPFIRLESGQREILEQPRDRPTTWLVEASDFCPLWIRGKHSTVAIRITSHPLLEMLCKQLQTPLVSTSANFAGKLTARSKLQMQRQFASQLDFIVTGFEAGGNRPSDIKSLANGNLLRSGH
jgi:L-threonylcarbamoyladenylate synthase